MGKEFIKLKISVGIPIYNEQELLNELIKRIDSSFKLAGLLNYEIVFTDNCSTDQSFDLLKKYASKKNSRIKVIKHARNYGYQTSLRTCLENSNGDYIAIMDGDLQDPPELIPEMLKKLLTKKANIVYGVRSDRAEKFFKKTTYKLFYKFWHKVADIEIQIDSGEFAIYDRYSANQILKFKEKNRFQRGIRAYLGLKQVEYLYKRNVRFKGVSKFRFMEQIKLALDGIYSFSFAPIRMILLLGINIFFFSLLLSIISIVFRILNIVNPAFDAGQMGKGLVQVFFILTTLFGVVIIMLGIIGEYVSRIYDEIRDRPIIISRVVKGSKVFKKS